MILDLFCGTKSWTKLYNQNDVISVDLNYNYNPTLVRNILTWDYKKDLKNYKIDIIFASPPCNMYFSNLRNGNRPPSYYEKYVSLALVNKTIEIIKYFKPKYYFIENPVGKIQKHYPKILGFKPQKVYYCMYGADYKKPTLIYSNLILNSEKCIHKSHKVNIKSLSSSLSGSREQINVSIIPIKLVEKIQLLITTNEYQISN